MTLLVIGAGFGRTGTSTLKLALEHLGFGPCCHGSDARHFKRGSDFWQRVYNHEPIDWDEFFIGYRSTVDSPSSKFYLELANKYPGAKLILTVRESNSWYESYCETVLPMIASSHGGRYFSFLFGHQSRDRDSMIESYEMHNEAVQRLIPPERLLVYDVSQGWPPLCEYLGVAIPDAPYPVENSRNDFASVVDGMLAQLQ